MAVAEIPIVVDSSGSNALILSSFHNSMTINELITTTGRIVLSSCGSSQPATLNVSSAALESIPSQTQLTSKWMPVTYRLTRTTPIAKSEVKTTPILASVGTRPNWCSV